MSMGAVSGERMQQILASVSETSGVPVDRIMTDTHDRDAITARDFAMFKARQIGMTYREIAKHMNRSHPTVLDRVLKIQQRIEGLK